MAESLRVLIWKDLLRKIQSGDLSTGERLPTEKELEIIYHASRTPVRQALDKLATEGHIIRRPGRGTYVSNTRPGTPTAALSGFSHYYRNNYRGITAHTLDVRMVVPTHRNADILAMPRNQKTLHLNRVRLINEQPVAYLKSVLAPRFLAEPFEKDREFRSMTAFLLEHFFVRCTHAKEQVDAILPSQEDAEVLQVSRGTPLLQVKRKVYDERGDPILSSRYLVNSAIWKYSTSLIV